MSKIREAVRTDEEAVFSLAITLYSPPSVKRASFHKIWLEKMSSELSYIAVAEFEESIVGYISGYLHSTLYSNNPIAWVDEILVREDIRKRGIGRKLMGDYGRWASDHDARLIALASQKGRAFYCSLGFREDASKYYKREISR
jgi:GNAT superfamily N-acetyltransferase